MRAHVISKIVAAVLVCVALGFAAPKPPAPQTTTSKTTRATAKPAAPRSAKRVVKKRKPRQKAQTVPTPARIFEIQSALAAQGAYKVPPSGQPSGRWDEFTIQAMKAFQSAHGLSPTGKLDALSLQKLGLGSEIAGRGAPVPQPQASSPSALQQSP
jgi:peptidoglycan hydrolase-like protein with peptidoglycan-binding domain